MANLVAFFLPCFFLLVFVQSAQSTGKYKVTHGTGHIVFEKPQESEFDPSGHYFHITHYHPPEDASHGYGIHVRAFVGMILLAGAEDFHGVYFNEEEIGQDISHKMRGEMDWMTELYDLRKNEIAFEEKDITVQKQGASPKQKCHYLEFRPKLQPKNSEGTKITYRTNYVRGYENENDQKEFEYNQGLGGSLFYIPDKYSSTSTAADVAGNMYMEMVKLAAAKDRSTKLLHFKERPDSISNPTTKLTPQLSLFLDTFQLGKLESEQDGHETIHFLGFPDLVTNA